MIDTADNREQTACVRSGIAAGRGKRESDNFNLVARERPNSLGFVAYLNLCNPERHLCPDLTAVFGVWSTPQRESSSSARGLNNCARTEDSPVGSERKTNCIESGGGVATPLVRDAKVNGLVPRNKAQLDTTLPEDSVSPARFSAVVFLFFRQLLSRLSNGGGLGGGLFLTFRFPFKTRGQSRTTL